MVTFLNRYFDAINAHDFAAYRRLFTPSLRGGLSAPAFQSGYGTTRDSAVTLRGVRATAAGEIQALVTFTSHQQASQSPTHSACTDWTHLAIPDQERRPVRAGDAARWLLGQRQRLRLAGKDAAEQAVIAALPEHADLGESG